MKRDQVYKYGPVFISPNLTKKQRILQKSLKERLKEKKENSEEGWTIKRWQVVKSLQSVLFAPASTKTKSASQDSVNNFKFLKCFYGNVGSTQQNALVSNQCTGIQPIHHSFNRSKAKVYEVSVCGK